MRGKREMSSIRRIEGKGGGIKYEKDLGGGLRLVAVVGRFCSAWRPAVKSCGMEERECGRLKLWLYTR